MLITLVLLVSTVTLKTCHFFCANVEKVSLIIPGICHCFSMTWSIEGMMALPKLLFHVPQQNSSKDTMIESFQIPNTVNPLLTTPQEGVFISNTFEGGGGGGLI